MHPSRPLGGGVGVRLTFGQAGPAFGRAALSAGALEAWRVQHAISPSARQGAARAAAPSEAAHSPLIMLPDARVDRLGQSYRDVFVCVVTDDRERSDRGVQIVPPLLLQFSVRVKRLSI